MKPKSVIIRELLEYVIPLEWSGPDYSCPSCSVNFFDKEDGKHKFDCLLQKLINEAYEAAFLEESRKFDKLESSLDI